MNPYATRAVWVGVTSRLLTLYSKGVPLLWGVVFVALLVFNTLQYQLFLQDWVGGVERFLLPSLFAGLCLWALRLPLQHRLVIANTLLAVMAALYAGEMLMAQRLEHYQYQAARASGQPYDQRDKLTVIRDLRRQGTDAYPVIRGENMLLADKRGVLRPVLSVHGRPLLPLASIPGTTVVSCNETGLWQIYQADRHGFNNPDQAWEVARPAIGLVGDSFTHGSCLPRQQDMAAHLRHRFGSVINLGVGGFGPLLELASLTEYLQPLRPQIVLWVFFEGNDLTENLPEEIHSPLLRRYLHDPGFRQDLIHRNREIAAVMRTYVDRRMTAVMNRVDNPYEGLVRYLSLDRLREAVGLGPVQIGYNFGPLTRELALFDRVLREARRRVSRWGGEFYLVYFPESDRYLSKFGSSSVRDAIYGGVRRLAAEAAIPMIDIAAAFAADPEPGTLYAYPGAHCSARGYRLAANTIARAVEHRTRFVATAGGPAGNGQGGNNP